MSDSSGYSSALMNTRPTTPESRPVTVKSQESGNTLPEEVGREADVSSLTPASLYPNAQNGEVAERSDEASGAEELEQAVAKLNDYVQNTERKLNFELNEEAGLTIIRVFDKTTDELIRQIPSEEAVSLAQKLNQEEPLLLFSAQV